MLDREATTLPKWPFLLGDVLLVVLGAWIIWQFPAPTEGHFVAVILCVATGAILGMLPFVLEHRAKVRLTEVRSLASITEQMSQLRTFSHQLTVATAQWQGVQDQSEKTIAAACEVTQRMTAEAKSFGEFLNKRDEGTKKQLRLELEKMRKAEGDWLEVTVRLLDHIYALHQAALRSGQPRLVDQMARFQHACRDTARRVGLVPFEAAPDETFNELTHRVNGDAEKPADGSRIASTIAPGFNYQGRLLRPALVTVATDDAKSVAEADLAPSAS